MNKTTVHYNCLCICKHNYFICILFFLGSDLVESEKSGIKIVISPYVVSFRNTPQYFKPGLPLDMMVILHIVKAIVHFINNNKLTCSETVWHAFNCEMPESKLSRMFELEHSMEILLSMKVNGQKYQEQHKSQYDFCTIYSMTFAIMWWLYSVCEKLWFVTLENNTS